MDFLSRTCGLSMCVGGLLASLLVAYSPDAHAEGGDAKPVLGGADEIALKNGGMLRGTIVDEQTGKYVILLVGEAGEKRTVPWRLVDRIEHGKHVVPPPSPPPPPPRPPPRCPPPKGKGVRVHIETDPDEDLKVRLYRWLGNTSWLAPRDLYLMSTGSQTVGAPLGEFACEAPCDRIIDGSRGHEFVFSGENVVDSAPIQLFDDAREVTYHVDLASMRRRQLGWLLATRVSPALIVAGGIGIVMAGPMTLFDETLEPATRIGSLIHLGAGFVLSGVGGGLFLANLRTSFERVGH